MIKFTTEAANEQGITLNYIIDNLPALEGSEKQISWATNIRKNMLNDFIVELARRCKIHTNSGDFFTFRDADWQAKCDVMENVLAAQGVKFNEPLETIINQQSAKFWIENRTKAVFSMTLYLAKGEKTLADFGL